MKTVLRLEEALLFGACLLLFPQFQLSWWWLVALFFLPDIGMIGYLINNNAGAGIYNLFHHKGIAVIVAVAGYVGGNQYLLLAGYILFAHSCFDRMLGYGLKLSTGFRYTHLGMIGRNEE